MPLAWVVMVVSQRPGFMSSGLKSSAARQASGSSRAIASVSLLVVIWPILRRCHGGGVGCKKLAFVAKDFHFVLPWSYGERQGGLASEGPAQGLRRRGGRGWRRPRRQGGRGLRAAGAERRRQNHYHRNLRGAARGRRRNGRGSRSHLGDGCAAFAAAPGRPASGDAARR